MAKTFRDLTTYRKAFELEMSFFEISKRFPKEERYSLTDQIRRSSRSVCSCIAEAYRKRGYENYFISKSSDADMENSETQVWLQFSIACKYITDDEFEELIFRSEEIGRLVSHMVNFPDKYLTKRQRME